MTSSTLGKENKELLIGFEQALKNKKQPSQEDSVSKSKILTELDKKMEDKRKSPNDVAHGDNKHTDNTHYDYHRDKHEESHTDRVKSNSVKDALVVNDKIKP